MKRIIIAILFVFGALMDSSVAAQNVTTRARVARAAPATTSAPKAANSTAPAVAARAAKTTAKNTTTSKTTATPAVAARAGATQRVVNAGSNVSSAATNSVINAECQQKYNGCMDTFCILENANGGRCQCNDKIKTLDAEFAEIQKRDAKSYALATTGVDSVKDDFDAISGVTNSGLDLSLWDDAPAPQDEPATTEYGTALYRTATDACVERVPECAGQIQMLKSLYTQSIKSDCLAYENSLKQSRSASATKLAAAEKALRDAALEQYRDANKYDLGQCTVEFKKCMTTTAGCGDDFSKCTSVSINNPTDDNKSRRGRVSGYSIGTGTTSVEISTGTFEILSGKKPLCDGVTKQCTNVADKVWNTFLRESATTIKSAELIAENNARQNCARNISECFQTACHDNIDPNDPDGSYDMCLTRPGTMLNFCRGPMTTCGIDPTSIATAEKSKIWDYVVARLAAMRVDACTTEVRKCLQSADRCGSDYTQCVGLDTDTIIRMCPYDKLTGCQKVYGTENVRDNAVYEQLATMAQGIMLNIDTNMLAKCQSAVDQAMIRVCGDADNCNNFMLSDNIGARSLRYRICEYGLNDNNELAIDYNKCRTDVSQISDTELGRVVGATGDGAVGPITPFSGVLDGVIYWESLDLDSDGKLIGVDEYLAQAQDEGANEEQRLRIENEIAALQSTVNGAIAAVESDPTVQYCVAGRKLEGVSTERVARFPNLTKSTRIKIAHSALKAAQDNYYKQYDALQTKMLQDYVTIADRMSAVRDENDKDARREAGRISCVGLADVSTLPKSKAPPRGLGGVIVSAIAVAIAVVVVSVFTFGAGAIAAGAGAAAFAAAGGGAAATSAGLAAGTAATTAALAAGSTAAAATSAGLATAAATTSAITAAASAAGGAAAAASLATSASIATAAGVGIGAGAVGLAVNGGINGYNSNPGTRDVMERTLSGEAKVEQWNFKEYVTTKYNWETLECHRCIKRIQCADTKTPAFGEPYCKTWSEPTETCTDTQF